MARKKKRQTKVVLQLDRRFRLSFRLVFTMLLIFAGCMGLAFTLALTTETRHKITEARALVQTQRDDNIALKAQITEKYTLDEIKRQAEGRLGMIKPDPSQIIIINVPKQNYSELSEGEEPEPESVWRTITSFFKNLIKLDGVS